jgi:hypothetical protein
MLMYSDMRLEDLNRGIDDMGKVLIDLVSPLTRDGSTPGGSRP